MQTSGPKSKQGIRSNKSSLESFLLQRSQIKNKSFSYQKEELGITELSSSLKVCVTIVLAYLLDTTQYYEMRNVDGQIKKEKKILTDELLEKLSVPAQITPQTIKNTINKIKEDQCLKNEITDVIYGIMNYLDKHYKTSSIWEVQNPEELVSNAQIYKAVESECVKMKKANIANYL